MCRTRKLTRRAYHSRMDALSALLLDTEAEWDALAEACTTGLIPADQHPEAGDRLNSLADKANDLRTEMRDLESQWQTRHWTAAEWTSWDLITSNID